MGEFCCHLLLPVETLSIEGVGIEPPRGGQGFRVETQLVQKRGQGRATLWSGHDDDGLLTAYSRGRHDGHSSPQFVLERFEVAWGKTADDKVEKGGAVQPVQREIQIPVFCGPLAEGAQFIFSGQEPLARREEIGGLCLELGNQFGGGFKMPSGRVPIRLLKKPRLSRRLRPTLRNLLVFGRARRPCRAVLGRLFVFQQAASGAIQCLPEFPASGEEVGTMGKLLVVIPAGRIGLNLRPRQLEDPLLSQVHEYFPLIPGEDDEADPHHGDGPKHGQAPGWC